MSNITAKHFVLRLVLSPKTNIKNVPLPYTFVFATVEPAETAFSPA
jgi:hypothetical protein